MSGTAPRDATARLQDILLRMKALNATLAAERARQPIAECWTCAEVRDGRLHPMLLDHMGLEVHNMANHMLVGHDMDRVHRIFIDWTCEPCGAENAGYRECRICRAARVF